MHELAHPIPIPHEGEVLYDIRSLGFTYPNGRTSLTDIDLTICRGDRIALVGQNGAGKTTLVKHLNGLLQPGTGRVLYKGKPLTGDHLRSARLEIGLFFQDPDDQLFCNTVYEDVAFGPMNQGLSRLATDAAVDRALTQTGLSDMARKAPHHLSYGQKKRAALATLLAMSPEALILDEPTANLDPRQEAVFMALLESFPGTLIIISHDLIFLYNICPRVVVLDQGRIHHNFRMKDLVAHRESLREHGLDFSFRFSCCRDGDHGHAHAHGPEKTDPPGDPSKPPLLRLAGYRFAYPDGTEALRGVDLTIHEGDTLAVLGENGAGKTTLLSCLMGILRGRGTYEFKGEPVTSDRHQDMWREIGMVFQNSADQLFCPTCYDEVAFGPRHLGLPADEVEGRVRSALADVALEGCEDRVPLHMSGGERKRLAIACVLSMAPKVLILDEPTAGLDPRSEELLMDILRNLPTTKILVSHDIFLISSLTRRTIVMHRGMIIRDYPTRAFLSDDGLTSLNQLAFTYKNDCSAEIMALQNGRP